MKRTSKRCRNFREKAAGASLYENDAQPVFEPRMERYGSVKYNPPGSPVTEKGIQANAVRFCAVSAEIFFRI